MGEVLQFEASHFDLEQFRLTCVNIFSRLHYLYTKEESTLEDYEKALYQRVQKIIPKILKDTWLTPKERKLFLEKIEPFFQKEEEMEAYLFITNYIYLSDIKGITFLKQETSSMSVLIEAFIEGEIPYTSYDKFARVFLKREFLNKLSNYSKNKAHLLVSLMEDVHFEQEEDLVLTKSLDYVEQSLKPVEFPHYERDMFSIYQYYLRQMEGVNELLCPDDKKVFSSSEFEKLKKILRFVHLDLEHQQNFYDTIDAIEKNYALIERCKLLMNMIDFYIPLLENQKVIYSNRFGGTDNNENRRL